MSSTRLAVVWRCAAAAAATATAVLPSSLLGKHFPPDDQLTHSLLGRQWQQAVVLAVQAHIQQVLFGKVVGDQVGLQGGSACMMASKQQDHCAISVNGLVSWDSRVAV